MTTRAAVVASLLLVAGCGGSSLPPATPSASPTATPGPGDVVPGPSTGPTRITFAGAEPAPGSDVAGCGPAIAGCRGRVTVHLDLRSPAGGPILYARVFLHSTSLRACLLGQTGPRVLRAGEVERIDVTLDDADDCRTPTDIRTMAAVVEGTVEVASRQEWSLRYTFLP